MGAAGQGSGMSPVAAEPAWVLDPPLLVRLAVGLAQGLGLFALKRLADAGEQGPALAGAFIAVVLLPAVLLAGVGAMRPRSLAIWSVLAGVGLFGLGYYAEWRATEGVLGGPPIDLALLALLLFIIHHLVQVPLAAGRWRAPYADYFDLSWKRGVQLALAGLFTGAFWLVLFLAAALFRLIGITAVEHLIREDWFYFPATTLAFAAAVHLTDARAGLVIGARALALTLLSWLAPLMALIAAAFLAALPLRGLDALWAQDFGSALLLWAAVALVFLINAAYQAGERPKLGFLAWSVRGSAVLIAPLAVLAAIGIGLRVAQYGLTPGRVLAIAGVLILACYALAYLAAAFWRGPWLGRLGQGNVACAYLSSAVLLALLTPVADPGRLSAESQVARLERGAVSPEAFDYAALSWRMGRHGREALERLAAGADLEVAALARTALAQAPAPSVDPADIPLQARRLAVAPIEAEAPDLPDQAFLPLDNGADPVGDCAAHRGASPCSRRMLDLDRDGASELLIQDGGRVLLLLPGAPGEPWRLAAEYCCVETHAWREAPPQTVEPRFQDLRIGDQLIEFSSGP